MGWGSKCWGISGGFWRDFGGDFGGGRQGGDARATGALKLGRWLGPTPSKTALFQRTFARNQARLVFVFVQRHVDESAFFLEPATVEGRGRGRVDRGVCPRGGL